MLKSRRVVGPRVIIGCVTGLAILAVLVVGGAPFASVSFAQDEVEVEPAPPADATYIGAKKCSSCHFQQFMTWKSTRHASAFKVLTSKYEKDATCLPCHTTGYGKETGYTDGNATLAGVTCEVCHSPGSKHEELATPYAKEKNIPEDAAKAIRDAMYKLRPGNVCITCHKVQAHGKSSTPPDMKK